MPFKIKEQPNVFDDAFLDIIGNEFKFDHVKGLAEWLKNSADAYTRADIPDSQQHIYLSFRPREGRLPAAMACIDFVGMTSRDIDEAFKRWGDRRAAGRGTGKRTLGGHGNGGKFYMRQMFKTSQFVTFRDGRLNVFGFNERKRYGYAEGFQDKKVAAAEALKFAGIENLETPAVVRERWARSGVGFTVVTGETPDRVRAWTAQTREISQKLKVHPQSRRLVRYKEIGLWLPGRSPQKLTADNIAPKPGFEGPHRFEIPRNLPHGEDEFVFRNRKYPDAWLELGTTSEPFGRSGERSALNSVDILGEVGCIGSYRMNELGYLRFGAQAEFLYGECYCPILEDESDDCVRNDREKLVESDKTRALLEWIRARVDELCSQIAEEERRERKRADLRQSSSLNELLNRWKNRFMAQIISEVIAGAVPGDGIGPVVPQEDGGGGGGGEGTRGNGRGGDRPSRSGGGGSEDTRHAKKFPRVLLSGHDTDPLDPSSTIPYQLDPRHPAIYQRREDVSEGIYWINTSRPLAQRIIEQYQVKSTRWREYLFQRYVDIIMKESLYQLSKRDPEMTAEKVDDLWDSVQSRIHDSAAENLEAFLFEEAFAANGGPDSR